MNPRKCTAVLAKILYLLNQGEVLGTTEATECFFAITKLFQAKDTVLRRLVYLGIKELSSIAEDVIIVTSSLTKDMTGKEDCYRAAAIRALCTITDPVMLQVWIMLVQFCYHYKNIILGYREVYETSYSGQELGYLLSCPGIFSALVKNRRRQ